MKADIELNVSRQNRHQFHSYRFVQFSVIGCALLMLTVGCPTVSKAPKVTPADVENSADKVSDESAKLLESDSESGSNLAATGIEAKGADSQAQPQAHDVVPSEVGNDATVETSAMEASKQEPLQTWTTQRIFGLGTKGPVIIDLSVNIGGRSLEEVAQAAIDKVAEQIAADLKKPWNWPDLLDHPIVKSGWLGNLMPQQDQRDQIIGMYNTDGDDEVDDDELAAFLTRGLARGKAMRFTDAGSVPASMVDLSPWGQLDVNHDNTLDKAERESVVENGFGYDINGDRIVTRPEITAIGTTNNEMEMSSRSMLDTSTAIAYSAEQTPSQLAGKLLGHYTFLAGVTREQWSSFSDAAWQELNSDGDLLLSKLELEKLTENEPQLVLYASFPDLGAEESGKLTASMGRSSKFEWESRIANTGQVNGTDFTLAVSVNDSYSDSARQALRARLATALNNPQLESFIRSQLQLSDEAFKVLDSNSDKQLSDDEFERVWGWVTGIRGTRALARWSLTGTVWFELADRDGDSRVTELELQRLVELIEQLDANHDGLVTPNEMPTAARLEVLRVDERFAGLNGEAETPETVARAEDWFSAMDSNGDGYVSSSEFLGSKNDFLSYDSDIDGFISRSEGFRK